MTRTAGPLTSPGVEAVTLVAWTETRETVTSVVKLTGVLSAAFLVGTGGGAVGPLAAFLAGGFQVPEGEGSGTELVTDGDPGAEPAGVDGPDVGATALVDGLAAEDAADLRALVDAARDEDDVDDPWEPRA